MHLYALKRWSRFPHSWNLGWLLSNRCGGNSVLGFPGWDLQVLTWSRGDTIRLVRKSRLSYWRKRPKEATPGTQLTARKEAPDTRGSPAHTLGKKAPAILYSPQLLRHSRWSATLSMWPSWILQPTWGHCSWPHVDHRWPAPQSPAGVLDPPTQGQIKWWLFQAITFR